MSFLRGITTIEYLFPKIIIENCSKIDSIACNTLLHPGDSSLSNMFVGLLLKLPWSSCSTSGIWAPISTFSFSNDQVISEIQRHSTGVSKLWMVGHIKQFPPFWIITAFWSHSGTIVKFASFSAPCFSSCVQHYLHSIKVFFKDFWKSHEFLILSNANLAMFSRSLERFHLVIKIRRHCRMK